jgi:hypothetical protein
VLWLLAVISAPRWQQAGTERLRPVAVISTPRRGALVSCLGDYGVGLMIVYQNDEVPLSTLPDE